MLLRISTLAEEKWFHGDLSRQTTEGLLRKAERRKGWLVRYTSKPGDFGISVLKHSRTITHYLASYNSKVDCKEGRFTLKKVLTGGQTKVLKTYDSLQGLLLGKGIHKTGFVNGPTDMNTKLALPALP